MIHRSQNSNSIWQKFETSVLLPLGQDLRTDVCVVGGGIAGLTTAYLLLKNGFKVAVLEKENFALNETALTSGHLSSILDEGFAKLIHQHGLKGARLAYESHCDAIDLIEKIIAEESIACDFHRLDGYLFLDSETPSRYLENELEACQQIGLKEAYIQAAPRYFANFGPCIAFPNQAHFHPLKYMNGLLQAIQKMGGQVFGLTSAQEVVSGKKNRHVKTESGYQVHAEHIVVATNVPINDRVFVHTKESAYRSYVIGFQIPSDSFPDILMWDTASPYHYVRKVLETETKFDTLLIGGEDHRVGQEDLPEQCYEKLAEWARVRLGIQGPLSERWSGQIIEPIDGLAYIGKNPGDENVYIVCGDSGHGLTHGTIAGIIIRDLIQHIENEWIQLYDPARIHWRALPQMMQENLKSFAQYEDHLHLRKELRNEELKPGEGTLVKQGLHEVAVYCDEALQIHSFSAICPHLGGVVHWNSAEKTWDCPCHGSRFACTGEVLNGPATTPLRLTELPVQFLPQVKEDHATSRRNLAGH